jgi:hypothetical protein
MYYCVLFTNLISVDKMNKIEKWFEMEINENDYTYNELTLFLDDLKTHKFIYDYIPYNSMECIEIWCFELGNIFYFEYN